MKFYRLPDSNGDALAEIAIFAGDSGVTEYHIIIRLESPNLLFAAQLQTIMQSFQSAVKEVYPGACTVFRRFFVSDAINQAAEVERQARLCDPDGVVSVIGQAPLNGTKIALWAYLQKGSQVQTLEGNIALASHNGYTHLWSSEPLSPEGDARCQTERIFRNCIGRMGALGFDLASHCMRTWLLINDIDNNYAGVVEARNDVFDTIGLTNDTHFIASTGISGRPPAPRASVMMDTYAVKGLQPQQVQHLYAPAFLNPTHEYGVRFERGTCIHFGDRREVFISGTASIGNKGEIVWPGDIVSQTHRMWDNVEALLAEAECTFADLAQIIVYLRDPADYYVVSALFKEKFPEVPHIIVNAPVCRPGWLVEMECIAIKADSCDSYIPF